MKLPVKYADYHYSQRWKVREAYVKQQKNRCHHCNELLTNEPADFVLKKHINTNLFPDGFFKHPVHLHHSHQTGMTIGAVHCKCNAVLWQYHGE